jgi:retron-type reverse transcriptase
VLIVSFENLVFAAHRAAAGKRGKYRVCRYLLDLEKELFQLQGELKSRSYRPGKYRIFRIYEPKPRLISAAPFRDRVVHHALCNVIEPIFDRGFIYDSYACRRGKGTHRAVVRFQGFCRKSRYVLKLDIEKYFPSIDHEILKAILARRIRCRDTLWLIGLIIDSSPPQERVIRYFPGDDLFTPVQRGKGIPIGNLTSQFFANLYLDGLDHFIKEGLRCRYYLRYVDDLVVFGDDKKALWEVRDRVSGYLERLRLKLHPVKSRIFRVEEGIEFLGFRIFPTHLRIRAEGLRKFRRRERWQKRAFAGEISVEKLGRSLRSWIAHASWADSFRLRRRIFGRLIFGRV